jgi:hypothetical protein
VDFVLFCDNHDPEYPVDPELSANLHISAAGTHPAISGLSDPHTLPEEFF